MLSKPAINYVPDIMQKPAIFSSNLAWQMAQFTILSFIVYQMLKKDDNLKPKR